eukprot:UN04797
MIPQQAVSMGSHSHSKGSHSKPRKASAPISTGYQQKRYKSNRRATSPTVSNSSPTPIIESRTTSCYPPTANVEKDGKKKDKTKKKKSKKFFKLSLSIFGSKM